MPRPAPRPRRRRAHPAGALARYRHLGSWALTAVLALAAGGATATIVGRAADAERAWGERRPVAMADRDLAPGDVIAGADVTRRPLPLALIPRAGVDDPVGRVVTAPIVAGEPVVEDRLAGPDDTGAAALVPDGHAAVAVALDAPAPPLRIGDRVDLVAPGALGALGGPTVDGGPGTARRVTRGATVVDVGETAVTVAVADDDVTTVAAATLQGPVAVVLTAAP
jgi:Flp pilus assembly protein CpaB